MKKSRLLLIVFCLSPFTTTSRAGEDQLGAPVIANGVMPLNIGRNEGQMSFRIRAKRGGVLTGFTYFNRHDFDYEECQAGNAYSKGTGGEYLVRFVEDDGTCSHLPDSGAVLAQVEIPSAFFDGADCITSSGCSTTTGCREKDCSVPSSGCDASSCCTADTCCAAMAGFRDIDFDAPVTIQEGGLYHLWFVNTDPNQTENWASVNNLNPTESYNPTQPAYDDVDLAILYKTAGTDWTHQGDHTPIYKLHFQDGGMQSQGYITAFRTSAPRRVTSDFAVRQLIENVQEDFSSSRLVFALKKFGAPGTLRVTVKNTDDPDKSESKIFDVASSNINNDTTQVHWNVRENSEYTFEKDESYYIEFTLPSPPPSSTDYYEFFPLQDGSVLFGFENGGTLTNGYAQYTEDISSNGAWQDGWRKLNNSALRKDGDLMVYFEKARDCNSNGVLDTIDIEGGTSNDCNSNGTPDSCDIASGTSNDCNQNDIPDACDVICGPSDDCNTNGVPDECDISSGISNDCNTNGIPDACDAVADGDFDDSGTVDLIDFGFLADCQGGPEAIPVPTDIACIDLCLQAFDANFDGDVDLQDFAEFVRLQ